MPNNSENPGLKQLNQTKNSFFDVNDFDWPENNNQPDPISVAKLRLEKLKESISVEKNNQESKNQTLVNDNQTLEIFERKVGKNSDNDLYRRGVLNPDMKTKTWGDLIKKDVGRNNIEISNFEQKIGEKVKDIKKNILDFSKSSLSTFAKVGLTLQEHLKKENSKNVVLKTGLSGLILSLLVGGVSSVSVEAIKTPDQNSPEDVTLIIPQKAIISHENLQEIKDFKNQLESVQKDEENLPEKQLEEIGKLKMQLQKQKVDSLNEGSKIYQKYNDEEKKARETKDNPVTLENENLDARFAVQDKISKETEEGRKVEDKKTLEIEEKIRQKYQSVDSEKKDLETKVLDLKTKIKKAEEKAELQKKSAQEGFNKIAEEQTEINRIKLTTELEETQSKLSKVQNLSMQDITLYDDRRKKSRPELNVRTYGDLDGYKNFADYTPYQENLPKNSFSKQDNLKNQPVEDPNSKESISDLTLDQLKAKIENNLQNSLGFGSYKMDKYDTRRFLRSVPFFKSALKDFYDKGQLTDKEYLKYSVQIDAIIPPSKYEMPSGFSCSQELMYMLSYSDEFDHIKYFLSQPELVDKLTTNIKPGYKIDVNYPGKASFVIAKKPTGEIHLKLPKLQNK